MPIRITLLLLFILSFLRINGQRFSFNLEAGLMRTQIDGDKIQGFHYNGYTFGIGSHYALDNRSFIGVKTAYYKQGSKRKDPFQPRPREGYQMEIDMNSVGLELSYKFDPPNRSYFLGFGFVQQQLIFTDFTPIGLFPDGEPLGIPKDQLRSGYSSVKLFYGFTIFPKTGVYLAVQSGITNVLRYETPDFRVLTPYAISAVFTYDIIASEVEERKQRPGSKQRPPRQRR